MSKPRLIPPEFMALVPPSIQDYPPRIKGFIFKDYDGDYYRAAGQGVTRQRKNAYVYSCEEAMKTCGTIKEEGHWIVVYEE